MRNFDLQTEEERERIYQFEVKDNSSSSSSSGLSFDTESKEFQWKPSKEENTGKLQNCSSDRKRGVDWNHLVDSVFRYNPVQFILKF